MAKKDSSRKPKNLKVEAMSNSISAGGNVEKSVLINGNNNVVYYYAANGEKREMRTGWFFGHRYGDLGAFTGLVSIRLAKSTQGYSTTLMDEAQPKDSVHRQRLYSTNRTIFER